MLMFSRFIVTCHVSTIPKSPPKMIRDKKLVPAKKPVFFAYVFIFTIFVLRFYNGYTDIVKNSSTWSKGLKDAVEYTTLQDIGNIIFDSNSIKSEKEIVFIHYLYNYDFTTNRIFNKRLYKKY